MCLRPSGWLQLQLKFWTLEPARLRGRTATQRSEKGSEKVLERVLGKGFWGRGSGEGVLRRGSAMGFTVKKGSEKGSQKGFWEGNFQVPRTRPLVEYAPLGVRPTWIANPFPPYSFQKRPEPQICPKSVPAIVFGGSSQGDWNLSKICQNLQKFVRKLPFFKFWQIFDQFQSPWLEPPKTIAGTDFGQIWGSGRFWKL